MKTNKEQNPTSSQEQISCWFDKIIAHFEADKFIMQHNLAPQETKQLYTSLISGNIDTLLTEFRAQSATYFAKNMVVDYVSTLLNTQHLPLQLAFSVAHNKVFIWATIKENDELTEDTLIEAEGRVNAQYYDTGFNISTTLVEDCDAMNIPSHYITIPINEPTSKWPTS